MGRNGRRSTGKSNKSTFGNFVTVDFDDRQRAEINDWLGARTIDFYEVFPKILESGCKVSFSYSEHYGCYFGTITVKPDGAVSEGHSYGLRHADLHKLFGILVYVLETYLSGGDGAIPVGTGNNSW